MQCRGGMCCSPDPPLGQPLAAVKHVLSQCSCSSLPQTGVSVLWRLPCQWRPLPVTEPGHILCDLLQHRETIILQREIIYLRTHSTHFIYGYMASDIWLRTILIVRKETRCRHMGYSFRLTARVLLYAPSNRQDSIHHGLCYTSRRALAGTRNSSMGSPYEGSIRRPIAPWAINSYHWATSRSSQINNYLTMRGVDR